jgi:RecB family exonuclease/sulfur carrier protein ThiS
MVQKGISPQNIVVIVPDEKFSFYLQLFDSQNYFNYAMGKSIQNSSLYIDAHALYEYLNEKEHQQKAYIEFIELCFDAIKTEFEPFFNQNITEALLNALIEFLKTREQNQEILEKFDEKIYTLKQLLFKYEEPILFKEAFKFLLQKISEITLDDTSGGKITVMGLLETRGLSFEGVVIVDFNEDIVPKRSIKDKFISTKVKHVAKLPTIKDRENLQKYYYERLCSQAKELYISYVHNETQQISRFAHELFDASSIKASKADELYETILYQTHSIQHLDEKIELDINLADFKWSASSLKRYLTCKRSFYLNYILKLKEHHFGLKPQSFELGSYIHKVLETFFEQNQQVLSVMPNDILNAYFNLQKVKNPYLLLQLGLWQKKLEVFIQNEKEAFKTNRTLFKTEFAFEFEHCNIRLKGVIDRVDCLENSFEIIDYKTSSHLVVDTKRTYENTKDFQLEFYYLAMKRFIEQNPKYHHFSLHPFYYDLHQSCKYEETMLYEKLDILEHILKQLHTKTVNFEKTHDKAACQYCAYKTICCR